MAPLRYLLLALAALCISGCGGSVTDPCPLGPEPVVLLRRSDEAISRVVVDETKHIEKEIQTFKENIAKLSAEE